MNTITKSRHLKILSKSFLKNTLSFNAKMISRWVRLELISPPITKTQEKALLLSALNLCAPISRIIKYYSLKNRFPTPREF
jgi:hypothetical protein